MHGPIAVAAEIHVVVAPIMREIAAHKNDVTGLEPLDVIADELRAVALGEDNELHFRVVVPAVIDKRVPVLPYAEGMGGGPWYLEEFRLHADCKGKTDGLMASIGGRSIRLVRYCCFPGPGARRREGIRGLRPMPFCNHWRCACGHDRCATG